MEAEDQKVNRWDEKNRRKLNPKHNKWVVQELETLQDQAKAIAKWRLQPQGQS